MKEISRKDFLKGASLSAAAFALSLTGCAQNTTQETASKTGLYTPGTYTGKATGMGEVVCTMTFSDSAITDVQLDLSYETKGYGYDHKDEFVKMLMDMQSADIDVVSGSTVTSNAVKEAALKCIQQAKGEIPVEIVTQEDTSENWLGKEPEIADSDISETLSTDICVVGGGNAGTVAAYAAAQTGSKVIMIDKVKETAHARGWMGAFTSPSMREKGVKVEKKEFMREFSRYASYNVDQRLLSTWYDNAESVVDWLDGELNKYGAKMVVEEDVGGDSYYKGYPMEHACYDEEGNQVRIKDVLFNALSDVGVDVRVLSLVKLVKDGDTVTGVICKDDSGKYTKIEASKGVIIATGGYAANLDMLKALNPRDYYSCTQSTSPATNTGEGIKACLWAGAAKDDIATTMLFDRGAVPVGSPAGAPFQGTGLTFTSQPFLTVNKAGERFMAEDAPYDFCCHAISKQPDRLGCMIWDSNWQEDVARFRTLGCSRIQLNPNATQEAQDASYARHASSIDKLIESDIVVKADTIEELAEKLQIDADTLKATIDRYNEMYDNQEDTDFFKDSYRLSAVRQAPYYGVFSGARILCTLDGIRINNNCEAIDISGNAIKHLYVAGNDAGGFFGCNYPELFIGCAMSRSVTTAYMAAQNASKN